VYARVSFTYRKRPQTRTTRTKAKASPTSPFSKRLPVRFRGPYPGARVSKNHRVHRHDLARFGASVRVANGFAGRGFLDPSPIGFDYTNRLKKLPARKTGTRGPERSLVHSNNRPDRRKTEDFGGRGWMASENVPDSVVSSLSCGHARLTMMGPTNRSATKPRRPWSGNCHGCRVMRDLVGPIARCQRHQVRPRPRTQAASLWAVVEAAEGFLECSVSELSLYAERRRDLLAAVLRARAESA
jgi:hypothetical protein